MSSTTITVEPVAPPTGRVTEHARRCRAAGVGLAAAPQPDYCVAPDLIEPVVGFRNWRLFRTGPGVGELSSPYFPVSWSESVVRAECRRWSTAEALLDEPHAAPHPECGCGIRAYRNSTGEFSKLDFRGVSGIVTVWGRIEIGPDEIRAEIARVEALGLYSRWSRRQREAVADVAARLGADVVDLEELDAAAASYGAPPPPWLFSDSQTKGMRSLFAALVASRVGD